MMKKQAEHQENIFFSRIASSPLKYAFGQIKFSSVKWTKRWKESISHHPWKYQPRKGLFWKISMCNLWCTLFLLSIFRLAIKKIDCKFILRSWRHLCVCRRPKLFIHWWLLFVHKNVYKGQFCWAEGGLQNIRPGWKWLHRRWRVEKGENYASLN